MFFNSQLDKENFLQFIWVDFVHQVKNKDGVVKMTVSNGLMKNNFSYATVMTMSSEVGYESGRTRLYGKQDEFKQLFWKIMNGSTLG